MAISKITLLAAGLALGLSTMGVATKSYAQAQNTPGNMISDVGEDEALLIMGGNGKMMKAKGKMSAASHTKAMGMGGRELPMGAMVYRHGGKLYLVENKAGAKTSMVQETFTDMFDNN